MTIICHTTDTRTQCRIVNCLVDGIINRSMDKSIEVQTRQKSIFSLIFDFSLEFNAVRIFLSFALASLLHWLSFQFLVMKRWKKKIVFLFCVLFFVASTKTFILWSFWFDNIFRLYPFHAYGWFSCQIHFHFDCKQTKAADTRAKKEIISFHRRPIHVHNNFRFLL